MIYKIAIDGTTTLERVWADLKMVSAFNWWLEMYTNKYASQVYTQKYWYLVRSHHHTSKSKTTFTKLNIKKGLYSDQETYDFKSE